MPFQLDPEIAKAQLAMSGGQPRPPAPPIGDVATRRIYLNAAIELLSRLASSVTDVTHQDLYTSSPDGHSLLLRWYVKSGTSPRNSPTVLYIHGGGMIAYTVADYDNFVSQYVSLTAIPFLAVEFRSAPEFPYPTPVEDCYAGLSYLHSNASKLGVDSSRIAVMGDSGGGGIAACLANYALSKNGPSIAKQILMYPMLDDRNMIEDPSLLPFMTWNYVDNATAWQAFLGDAFGKDDVPPSASPGRLQDATGLPDLYMDACELDIFRDENIEYARKHAKAGISTELHVHPGVPHAFEALAPGSDVARRTMDDRIRAIKSIKSVQNAKLES